MGAPPGSWDGHPVVLHYFHEGRLHHLQAHTVPDFMGTYSPLGEHCHLQSTESCVRRFSVN